MTREQAMSILLQCRSKRRDLRLTARQWWSEGTAFYSTNECKAVLAWITAMESAARDVLLTPEPISEPVYMTEDDYVARIEAGETLKARVLA